MRTTHTRPCLHERKLPRLYLTLGFAWCFRAPARVDAVDELRGRSHLLENLFLEAGAALLELPRLAEHRSRAVLLPVFEKRHAEVHEVRRGRA